MTQSIFKTAAIAFAIAGSLVQLTSAQVIVGGDPSTWGLSHQHSDDLIVGGDPSTWSPTPLPHDGGFDPYQPEPHHGGIYGGDPSTWSPTPVPHHGGYNPYEPTPHHGGIYGGDPSTWSPTPVPHPGIDRYGRPIDLSRPDFRGSQSNSIGLPPEYDPWIVPNIQPGGDRLSLPHYGDGR
ncbi:MAG: hypothetical protein AAF456_21205 [Planctomycetota bacterium]